MQLATLVETHGESAVLATGGLLIGAVFGFCAQRSRFCLRAAVIEFWHRRFGEKLSVWLLAFATAVTVVQVLQLSHQLDVSTARQIANRGSLSGALLGGLLFGAGMVMTRGCASRLLVLSANGNLRALLSGLVFAVTAQASLSGALSPLRGTISNWLTIDGGDSRDLLVLTGAGYWGGLAIGVTWMLAAVFFASRNLRQKSAMWAGGIGCGLMVAVAWWFTYAVAQNSFQPLQIQGLTFSGPSAEWLMRVLARHETTIGFDFGMLPGVFLGSFVAAWLGKELKLEGFRDGYSMTRYIMGAILMGFGSMLAGGCAVGAGLTGGAVFAVTAWVSLIGMWGSAGVADRLLDSAATQHQHPIQTPSGLRAP